MIKRLIEQYRKYRQKKQEIKRTYIENNGTLREQYANLWFAYKFIFNTNKKLFVFRIPYMLMQTAQTIIPIFFIREILNELTYGRDIYRCLFWASAMVISIFIIKLTEHFLDIYDSRERRKFSYNVQKHFADSVVNMSYATVEDPEMQDYTFLAYRNNYEKILDCSSDVLRSVITLLGLGSVILSLDPFILAVVVFSEVIKFIISYKKLMIPVYEFSAGGDVEKFFWREHCLTDLMTSLENGKDVRVNNFESWILERNEENWKNNIYETDKKNLKKTFNFECTTIIVSIIQSIFIYALLAAGVINKEMTIGDFSMFLSAAGAFSGAIQNISKNYVKLMDYTGWYVKSYRKCIDIAQKMCLSSDFELNDIPENAEIEFRNVSFKYPKTDRMILENINITIKRGETLSIVGLNGAGKTTFVKLLCRLYEPTSGEIFINGILASKIALHEYYRLLSVVFQDFSMFAFSLKENIVLGTECDDDKFSECIKKAEIEDIINALSDGADTYMSKEFDKNGVELSGGEQQKVVIARAIYRDAPIIIFDEPTSALDPIAEYNIYRNFYDLASKRTAIYISHRLSSTRFTDKTAVFANATIAEYGTHEELMNNNNGIYKQMFVAQAKYYND